MLTTTKINKNQINDEDDQEIQEIKDEKQKYLNQLFTQKKLLEDLYQKTLNIIKIMLHADTLEINLTKIFI